MESSLGTHSVIRITSAIRPHESIDQYQKNSNVVTAGSAVGSFIVSPNSQLNTLSPPQAVTLTKRKKPMHREDDSDGESYDIDLQRTLAKSRREAKRL